jgi:hypothetical protein
LPVAVGPLNCFTAYIGLLQPHSDDMSRVVDQLLKLIATFIGLSRLSRSGIIWCINVFTSLLGLVIVSHLSPKGLGTLQTLWSFLPNGVPPEGKIQVFQAIHKAMCVPRERSTCPQGILEPLCAVTDGPRSFREDPKDPRTMRATLGFVWWLAKKRANIMIGNVLDSTMSHRKLARDHGSLPQDTECNRRRVGAAIQHRRTSMERK